MNATTEKSECFSATVSGHYNRLEVEADIEGDDLRVGRFWVTENGVCDPEERAGELAALVAEARRTLRARASQLGLSLRDSYLDRCER